MRRLRRRGGPLSLRRLLAGTCPRGHEYPDPVPGLERVGRVLQRLLHRAGACELAEEPECAHCGMPVPVHDVGGSTAKREPLCDLCARELDLERGGGS